MANLCAIGIVSALTFIMHGIFGYALGGICETKELNDTARTLIAIGVHLLIASLYVLFI